MVRAGAGGPLAAHDGDDDDFLKAGFAEDFRAFIHGGAGGEDVIDEDGACGISRDRSATGSGSGECAAQVFQPLGASEGGLMLGLAITAQGLENGEAGEDGEFTGDFLGLVEMAVLEALAVKRHGDERPFPGEGWGEAWIGK